MPLRLTLSVCALALIVPCLASSHVLPTGNALDVKLNSEEPILPSVSGPMVRGAIQVSPHPIKPVCERIAFYVDGKLQLATDAPDPRLLLDTMKLEDGEHTLRIEAIQSGKLTISTGSVAFTVANEKGSAVLDAAVTVGNEPGPMFGKVRREALSFDALWFGGLEGDLDKPSFIAGNRIYCTLTDLVRHIGGRIEWGPAGGPSDVVRNNTVMTIRPGSSVVSVNGTAVDIADPVVVKGGRIFVPVRKLCKLFGIAVEWNDAERRAYVLIPSATYGQELRSYPWVSPVTGDRLQGAPGNLSFRNLTSHPIHVTLQGNGFKADWQIRSRATLPEVFVAAGTYEITIWSAQGVDLNQYITVASAVHDVYYISHDSIELISR